MDLTSLRLRADVSAVYLTEERIRKLNPPADFVVDYGDRDEHCWNGDHTRANA